jgi:hypothetical protein
MRVSAIETAVPLFSFFLCVSAWAIIEFSSKLKMTDKKPQQLTLNE